ncbi:hypothetical protein LE181_10250 [Streptomyces sp. SCA3-4]|uniref:hypothetical protein n=1 Tax=Streptomyces sichuanensis TaxID=2871810 RepID=UPI001CE28C8C|nr:hypothetical protein [Streptomyces sichuanensis]MCA6092541.1 hypothetical protein [Streptomyces sichuanensis]
MPLIPEEPQIHESVPGPRAVPAAGRPAMTPRPVPGPRPAPARSGNPGPRSGPVPGPRPPRPAAGSPAATAQVQLIPAPAEGALGAADEAVDLLLDAGRAPGEVLVLTTGDPHPWAAHELSFGEASYWAQHDAGDDVFYAAADADRAATRPVVVVAVNGGSDAEVARALPAAMARAGALLIVCGDPKRVNALLSAGV